MIRQAFVALNFGLLVSSCTTTDSTPAVLVDSGQVALAVATYVQATAGLANSVGFSVAIQPAVPTLKSSLTARAAPASPVTVSLNSTASNSGSLISPVSPPVPAPIPPVAVLNPAAVTIFLKTGKAAASILCQEYIANLSDRAELLNYLKKEYGFAGTLTTTAFAIFKASNTTLNTFNAANAFINTSADAYSDYRYFKISDEVLLQVALRAQAALLASYTSTSGKLMPTTLAEALAAMHNIEHQCSHAGLRALINQTVSNSSIVVDADSGVVTSPPSKPPAGH
jgi:predicted nucleic acid-binding protein